MSFERNIVILLVVGNRVALRKCVVGVTMGKRMVILLVCMFCFTFPSSVKI